MLCTSVHIILSPCWQDFVPSTQCAAFIAQFAAAEEAAATPAAVNDGSKDEAHAERQDQADPSPMRFMPSASEDGSAELQSEGEVPDEPDPTTGTAPAPSAAVTNTPAAASSPQVQAAANTFSAQAARAAVTPDAACRTAERLVNNSSSSGSSSSSSSGSDASTSDSDSGEVQEAADGVPVDGSMPVPGCEVEADDDADGGGDGQLSSPDPAAAAESQVSTVSGG